MNDPAKPIDSFLNELKERAKELNCLYKVQELLNQPNLTPEELCKGVIAVIPDGWQYPEICKVEMTCQEHTFHTDGFKKTPWEMSSDILVQNERFGALSVVYTEEMPPEDEGPFLKEERKLHRFDCRSGQHVPAAPAAQAGVPEREEKETGWCG